jgi:aldehyde:ferredoxin oxidoreductase
MRNPDLPGGIMGKMLRVDLTSGTCSDEELTPEVARMWLGGVGLGAKILYDEVPPGVEWNDPENRLIIAAGPLAGTKVHGSGTYNVVTKGPMTNMAGSSQANGFFGSYLKFAGYDAIILQGTAPGWQYLWIGADGPELRDASDLLGMDCWEFDEKLHEDFGYKERMLSVIGIGQAGENLVRFAVISGDKGHVAAHNGVGAVMGSKKLKAIAIPRLKNQVPVVNPQDLPSMADELFKHAFEFRDRWLYRGGTAIGLSDMEKLGALPIKNYQTAVFPEHEKLNGLTFRANFEGRHTPCWGCTMNHLHIGCMTSGQDAGYVGEEPEYEGFSAFGSQIMNSDQSSAFKLSNLSDRYGFDANEGGWLIGWVMECYEKGVFTGEDLGGLELSWGNTKAVEQLFRMISYREGIGDLLAEGVMRASQKVGGEAADWAIYVKKGASPRGHDHRGRWTELLDTSTGNTSTIEATAGADPVDGLDIEPIRNRFDPIEVSTFVAKINGRRQFDDCLGVCRFDSQDLLLELRCFNAVTGLNYTPQDALRKGRQIVHLLRAFNFRHGLTPDLEEPSTRYASVPTDGAALGTNPGEAFPVMKANYYRQMGWDEQTGKPLPETLRALELEDLIPDFWAEERVSVR